MLLENRYFQAVPVLFGALLALGLSGCVTTEDTSPAPMAMASPAVYGTEAPTTATVEEPSTVKYFPSDEPARLGLENFNRGNYGLAERYFRDAVEKAPRDVTSWVGLAASYDRLARCEP